MPIIKKKNNNAFNTAIDKFLLEFIKADYNPDASHFIWRFDTQWGPYKMSQTGGFDGEHGHCFAVFGRFEIPNNELGNRFSGKYNNYSSNVLNDSIEDACSFLGILAGKDIREINEFVKKNLL